MRDDFERKIIEVERIKKCCRNTNKFLVYKADVGDSTSFYGIWQGRFILKAMFETQNDNIHKISLLDLFQHESKTFEVPKSNPYFDVYTLKYPFLLLDDFSASGNTSYLHLAKFNSNDNDLQIVQTFNQNNSYYVFVDSCDTSKFILTFETSVRTYNLVNGSIQFVKLYEGNLSLNQMCVSYFKDCVYDLQVLWNEEGNEIIEMKVLIWDLSNDETKTVELNLLPSNLVFTDLDEDDFSCYEWVRNQLFASVRFALTNDYGIAFADSKTRDWTVIDFATSIPITSIWFVSNQALMICAKNDDEKANFYRFPLRKPDQLRNMAWLKIVDLLRQAKIEDLYVEARKYLPLNSDIQSFVFTEE